MRDRSGWRATFRTAAITATVTSGFWIIAGALWLRPFVAPTGAPTAQASEPVVLTSPSPGAMPTLATALRQSASGLVIPVTGVGPEQLLDTFTAARSGGRRHDAIDIMAPFGTPVVAAAAGTVEKLFRSDRGGKTVYIRSPDRTTIYYYAHLDRYAPGLAEKKPVKRGEVIGTVGFTGNAAPQGPHLHFEIQPTTAGSGWWQHGPQLNPYPLLGGR
jgi:murein DD-endopeptidase MepM/ murein hydrolase activator NlpD